MSEIGKRLQEYWIKDGVQFRPGATEAELSAFEAKHHIRFPSDVRDYLLTVNGFESGAMDLNLFEFLSLGEMTTLGEWWSSPEANSYYILVDFLIQSHVYAIRLNEEAEQENPVVVCYNNEPIKIAESFTEFVDGYLEGKETILGY